MIKKIFFRASSRSVISSGLNFIITIVIIRFLGADDYNKYIVDLAVISLILMMLELIPSSYSLFKIQDNSDWIEVVINQLVISVFLVEMLVFFLDSYFSVFLNFNLWIFLYVIVSGIKRYQDIYLQSVGKVDELIMQDIYISIFRLILVVVYCFWESKDDDLIWKTLCISMFTSQVVWLFLNRTMLLRLKCILKVNIYNQIFSKRREYYPYYIGIFIKRIKDNLVIILAPKFIVLEVALTAFFLSYRAISFVIGQIRILESILNYRANISYMDNFSIRYKLCVVVFIQIIGVLLSYALHYFSDLQRINIVEPILLSFLIIPLSFNILGRAKAYSRYDATLVNISSIYYMLCMFSCVAYAWIFNFFNIYFFIVALVLSESVSLYRLSRYKG